MTWAPEPATREQAVERVVMAIEAFCDAKMNRDHAMREGENLFTHLDDVNETREHMRNTLLDIANARS